MGGGLIGRMGRQRLEMKMCHNGDRRRQGNRRVPDEERKNEKGEKCKAKWREIDERGWDNGVYQGRRGGHRKLVGGGRGNQEKINKKWGVSAT